MAENSTSNGLAFIVGGLVVVVAVLGYFVLGGKTPDDGPSIKIELPAKK